MRYQERKENKHFCFLVNEKTENILMHFFILKEPSTNHNHFQTREIRSLPGDNKVVVNPFLSAFCLMSAQCFLSLQVVRKAS